MRYIEVKSILGNNNNVNLYRGCTHGCIYCDSRSLCYQVGDFEDIAVKKDAIPIFEAEIKRKRKPGLITTGSMCDPYLPLERELQLTRQMLEIIRDHRFSVSLLTKSELILRDIDLIEDINQRARALVCMTITTYDDELCRRIERNVTVTSKRFACLELFRKRNIPIGIWLGPILPFINDSMDNMVKIVERCVEIGVRYIIVFDFGTTKRAGSQEHFYQSLDRYFPGIKEKYIRYYGNNYSCPTPNNKELWQEFKRLCEKYHILYDLGSVYQDLMKADAPEQLRLF
ncbi:MAG: radical SAM protein [Acholeplasmataceae bacterium]|jgi:DNA repair photolyase|nr:radical SAM protein [Acholeplasmataceae bacterium]